jgi:hypothetical protein
MCGTCYRRWWRLNNPGAEWVRGNHLNKVAWGAKTDEQRRDVILGRYGLTQASYLAMLEAQNGVCAVCSAPPKAGRSLHVDHCHSSGKVRGLLCPNCNSALGHAKDDQERLRLLGEYLKRHQVS